MPIPTPANRLHAEITPTPHSSPQDECRILHSDEGARATLAQPHAGTAPGSDEVQTSAAAEDEEGSMPERPGLVAQDTPTLTEVDDLQLATPGAEPNDLQGGDDMVVRPKKSGTGHRANATKRRRKLN